MTPQEQAGFIPEYEHEPDALPTIGTAIVRIIDNWDEWTGEAIHAAQVEQDPRAGEEVMKRHLRDTLEKIKPMYGTTGYWHARYRSVRQKLVAAVNQKERMRAVLTRFIHDYEEATVKRNTLTVHSHGLYQAAIASGKAGEQ